MADVAEIPFMAPASFAVGADVYKGTTRLRFRKNTPPTYKHVREGSLRPNRKTRIPTNQAPVEGSITSMSVAIHALEGDTAATATIAGVSADSGNAVTITLTNAEFLAFDGGGSRERPDESTIAFEADSITVVEST